MSFHDIINSDKLITGDETAYNINKINPILAGELTMNEMNQKNKLNHLFTCFDNNNITTWLGCGQFLSLYRDNRLNANEDIDICTWDSSLDKLEKLFFSPDFKEYIIKPNFVYGLVRSIKIKPADSNVVFDLMIYRKYKNIAWNPTDIRKPRSKKLILKTKERLQNMLYRFSKKINPQKTSRDFFIWRDIFGYGLRTIPIELFTTLKEYQIDGVDFHGPAQAEKYLEHLYGPDWKTPKNSWNWKKDERSFDPVNPKKIISPWPEADSFSKTGHNPRNKVN